VSFEADSVFLPQLRFLLAIPPEVDVKIERFSDSAGTYVTLDSDNPAIYKQLYRAAKAKLKLRLKVTVIQTSTVDGEPSAVGMGEQRPERSTTPTQPPSNGYLLALKSFPPSRPAFQNLCRIPGAFEMNNATTETLVDPPPELAQHDVLGQPPMTVPRFIDLDSGAFSIDCNHCHQPIPNEHYHCGICEKGDFDLCPSCLESGVRCDGEGHWLIKRLIRNGTIIPSVTTTHPPRKPTASAPSTTARLDDLSTPTSPTHDEGERTCNGCIRRTYPPFFVSGAH